MSQGSSRCTSKRTPQADSKTIMPLPSSSAATVRRTWTVPRGFPFVSATPVCTLELITTLSPWLQIQLLRRGKNSVPNQQRTDQRGQARRGKNHGQHHELVNRSIHWPGPREQHTRH